MCKFSCYYYYRSQLKQLPLASMLGLLEFVLVGLLFQNSFYFRMDFLLPRTSTVLFVLALMARLTSPKLAAWPAFHLKGLRLVSFPGSIVKMCKIGFFFLFTSSSLQCYENLSYCRFECSDLWILFPCRL